MNNQQNEIIRRLAAGEDMPEILKVLNVDQAVCKKWLKDKQFKLACRAAVVASREPAAPRDRIPGKHGGYSTGPDELSQRIYRQHLSDIASLERQKVAMLEGDPLLKGCEFPEIDARIKALRSCLDDYDLNKRFAAAHEPPPKRYDDD